MDLLKYLLQNIFKLVIILFVAVFVLWLGKLFYPSANLSSYASSTGIGYFFSGDWLPAPRKSGIVATTNSVYGFTYEPGPAYNGYSDGAYSNNIAWVTWSSTGTQVVYPHQPGTTQTPSEDTSAYRERSLYLRNLSVYDKGSIAYGQTIYGEARQEMFKNGTFMMTVIDGSGRVYSAFPAINTGGFATPGWARFQATVQNRLPAGSECALIFHSGTQNIKVGMLVTCR